MLSDPGFIARVAGLALVGWLAVVWACGLVYIAASYAESRHRLPHRSAGSSLRWMLREMWLIVWTQPLMPLFQLFGKRMGDGGGAVPVVLVHGYFQNRVDFIYLARRLRAAGAGPLYAFNFLWPQALETSSRQVARFVDQVREETGAEQVDLLSHSTGGLFVLDLIATRPEVVRRAAVIAIPARGVPWRGPVLGRSGSQLRVGSLYQSGRSAYAEDVPVLSVYSAHDNLVNPVTTSELEGPMVRNMRVEGPGHLGVLFDAGIGDAVVAFLGDEAAEEAPAGV